jgi:hypothetical protein
MYNYTSTPGFTTLAINVARRILAMDARETPEGAVKRAVAAMRYGDRVDVASAVKAVTR